MFKGLEKVFDIIGEILAVIMVIVFALLIINANFSFLPDTVLKVFSYVQNYGSLVLMAVVGLEAMSKRNFIFQIIFLCLVYEFFSKGNPVLSGICRYIHFFFHGSFHKNDFLWIFYFKFLLVYF